MLDKKLWVQLLASTIGQLQKDVTGFRFVFRQDDLGHNAVAFADIHALVLIPSLFLR